MKKTQRDSIYKTEEFEDLTLFANESFDTQDVDLFEFSIEESSPLTRLKSIILSLDWEINDEILQELADELDNLQSMWQGDKVAEVYLQGLAKIGGYIRSKGAYAHPNSIKLLLTFFYNFEKIISSENITGEEITQLLKGDVRKFKILQYQINQSEIQTDTEAVAGHEETAPSSAAPEETDPAKQLKATILGLDWEVTEESLMHFNTKLNRYRDTVDGNKPALVLLQGLQALGEYIAEERAEAHPEAFLLLHSFFEALEQVSRTSSLQMEQDQIQDLLVDRINRLNNLKLLIAPPTTPPASEARIDEMVDSISSPSPVFEEISWPTAEEQAVFPPSALDQDELAGPEPAAAEPAAAQATDALEAELDTLFDFEAMPAMETSDQQYPDEILPADAIHPVEDELADDFIEAHLSSKRGLMPALSDAAEVSGFNEEAEPQDLPAQSDLAEQLDLLFAETEAEEEGEKEPADGTGFAEAAEESQPVATLSEGDAAAEPATLEVEVEAAEADQNFLDIQHKLDDFFADTEEAFPQAEPLAGPVESIEQALFFDEESGIEPALAGSGEERGFSEEEAITGIAMVPMEEIEEKLDLFFNAEDEELETAPAASGATPEPLQVEQPDFINEIDLLATAGAESEEMDAMAPALSEVADSEPDLLDADLELTDQETDDKELEGVLDIFFAGAEADKQAAAEPREAEIDQLTQALEETMASAAPSAIEEDKEISLAALGALLPMMIRTPSPDRVDETMRLMTALRQVDWSAEQRSLVQLLESTLALAVRLPAREQAATEKLVNFLYSQLLKEQCGPEALTEAIGHYTGWLIQASAVMPLVPAMGGTAGQEPQFAYTAKELYFELSELRAGIRDEFAKLRHEMQHHRH